MTRPTDTQSQLNRALALFQEIQKEHPGKLGFMHSAIAEVLAEPPAKYDDTLLPFLALMRKELHANAGKGDREGWLAMHPAECLLELYYHMSKLQKAVKDNNSEGIREFSADVANMAMMMVDICQLLAPPAKCQNCDATTAEACNANGCHYLESGNGAPTLKTFTVFCRDASNTGTTWIAAVEAEDQEEAAVLGRKQCLDDWTNDNVLIDLEDIVVLGVAEGDVKILHWEDGR